MSRANQNNPRHNPITSSDSELQEFIDPPGGMPLDDPEVLSRERRGRPADRQKSASSDEERTSSAE